MNKSTYGYTTRGSLEWIEWIEGFDKSKQNRKAVWRCNVCGDISIQTYACINHRKYSLGMYCKNCLAIIDMKNKKVNNEYTPYDKVMFWLMLHKAKSIYNGRNNPRISLAELGRAWQLFRAEHRIVIR